MKPVKKNIYRIIALTLAIGLTIGSGVGAIVYATQNSADDKTISSNKNESTAVDTKNVSNVNDETVYVVTKDNGMEKERIVSADGKLYYKGYEDCNMPVTMSIKYYLDGKKIEGKDLAGKSGHVYIEISYKNNESRSISIDGKSANIYVPFMAVTGMTFDNEIFSNVKVTNGKSIYDGNRYVIVGCTFPGMAESLGLSTNELDIPSSFTVSADVKNFKLTTIMTLATNQVFNDIDLSSINNIEDLKSAISEFSDASTKMIDGTAKLYEGVTELKDKTKALQSGTASLSDGANTIYKGVGNLKLGVDQLSAGLGQISANSAELNAGAKQIMENSLATVDAQLDDLRPSFTAMGKTIDTLTIQNYKTVLKNVTETLQMVDEAYGTSNYTGVISKLTGASTSLDSCNAFYNGVISYTSNVDKSYQGSTQLVSGVDSLNDGAKTLSDGLSTLCVSEGKLVTGIDALYDGTKALNDGMKKMQKESIEKLGKYSDIDITNILSRIDALGKASKGYNSFGSLGSYDDVKFIYRTESIETTK